MHQSLAESRERAERYIAGVESGAQLLGICRNWKKQQPPCDVQTLCEGVGPHIMREFVNALACERAAGYRMAGILQQMVTAGVALKKGIYGVDEPESGTIHRGLSYVAKQMAAGDRRHPLVQAVEYAVLTVPESYQVKRYRRDHGPVAAIYHRDAPSARPSSFAEALQRLTAVQGQSR
ncbi:MAG: hypothetical protein DI582_09555 [Azospirillum brasilense]|nr:MAG: hypothetical protein DI582_09555 [Azospirillum brasilense]